MAPHALWSAVVVAVTMTVVEDSTAPEPGELEAAGGGSPGSPGVMPYGDQASPTGPSPVSAAGDRAYAVSLIQWRVDHGRWPTAEDIAPADGAVLVGGLRPGAVLHPADPAAAWHLWRDEQDRRRHE